MSDQTAAKANEDVAMVQRVLDREIAGYTPDRIGLILRTVAPPGTTPDELALFLSFCEARDLNPLMKQVYLMKDKSGRVSIVTGIDGLRLMAQRSGEYEGQVGPEWKQSVDEPWGDVPPEDNLYACRVGVLRTGFKQPIWAVVKFSEFVKTDSWAVNWRDRPAHMVAIRAESHALRKAFPAETAGVTVHYEGGSQVTVGGPRENPDGPITFPQTGMLHKLSKQLGYAERDDRLNAAEALIGREIESFKDLTRGEAHDLIDAWTQELDSRGSSEGHRLGALGDDVSPGAARDVEGAAKSTGAQRAPSPTVAAEVAGNSQAPSPSAARNVGGGSSMGKGGSTLRDTSEATAGPLEPEGSTTDQVASDPPQIHEPRGSRSTRRQPAPPNPEPSATENAGVTATGAASLTEPCPTFTGSGKDMAPCERVVDGVVCGWPRSNHGRSK